MFSAIRIGAAALLAAGWLGVCGCAFAAERVTLRNGFELDCARQEVAGDRVRLYLMAGAGDVPGQGVGVGQDQNYIEVKAGDIVRMEEFELPAAAHGPSSGLPDQQGSGEPTAAEMRELLTSAGAMHNVDADLLASVVRAESGGQTHAVSHAGAKGLMQLMPSTAAELGVSDAFAADQNIRGGAAYLDQLLTRYHDSLALALAAYNAGPAAVDRYKAVPPYPETRAYVARVIREFNRRKRLTSALSQASAIPTK